MTAPPQTLMYVKARSKMIDISRKKLILFIVNRNDCIKKIF